MTDSAQTFEQPESFAFSSESVARVEAIIAKYPDGWQASAVMPLLDLAQRQHDGWLPRAAMEHVPDVFSRKACFTVWHEKNTP